MFNPQSPAYQSDVLKPETRDELRQRLRKQSGESKTGNLRNSGKDSSVLGMPSAHSLTDSLRLDGLISPMSREHGNQNPVQETLQQEPVEPQVSAREVFQNFTRFSQQALRDLVERFDESRFAAALRANPSYRYGLAIAFAMLLVLLMCLLFLGGSQEENQPSGNDPTHETVPVPAADTQSQVSVWIMSAPSEAKITVDGKPQRQRTPAKFDLAPGPHAVLLEKAGYDPWMEIINVKAGETEHLFSGFRLRKETHATDVTIIVEDPTGATIQIGDSVHRDTNRLRLPLAPGLYSLRVQKDGYEVYDKNVRVLELPEQELPAIRLERIRREPETVTAPVQILSVPKGAAVLYCGEPTEYITPTLLHTDSAKDDFWVRLEGYRVREVVRNRQNGLDVLNFFMEPVSAALESPKKTRIGGVSDYGLMLDAYERRSLSSAIDKLLNEVWNASPNQAVPNARRKVDAWEGFANFDPRLYHAQGLALWHHGKIKDAKNVLAEAQKRERSRPGQKVPYYPLYRDKIRLETALGEEELAAEDLLDLIEDTVETLRQHPAAGLDEAEKNADFAGRMMAYLEGPAKARLSGSVNPRLKSSEILRALPSPPLQEIYKSARAEVQDQYQEELAIALAQHKARAEREKTLQESGELGTTQIRSLDKLINGQHASSDYNAQTVTPFRIPQSSRVVANDRGVVRISYGPAGFLFPNLLFTSGPAISRSIFNNRTNDTRRLTHKKVLEKLPSIARRRPEALTTYMPEELERKRRDILESVYVDHE